MCGGGSGAVKRAAQQQSDQQTLVQQQAEAQQKADAAVQAAKQKQVTDSTNAINTQFGNTFTDDFFNNIAKKYTDTYTPQLTDQFTNARKQLAYNLSNQGLTSSSAAADQLGKLQDTYNTTEQGIQDKGLAAANSQRANVASTQSNLLNQANAGSDLNSINNLVASNLQTLQAPVTYDPLGSIFAQLASTAGQAAMKSSNYGQNAPFSSTNGPNVSSASSGSGVRSY